MNKKQLKETDELRQRFFELYNQTGLVGIEEGIHLTTSTFQELIDDGCDIETKTRNCDDFAYRHDTKVDGIKIFCINNKEEI